ncbi:hypothetical protein J2W24_002928 [Variovorax boronicumulans]|nr:hypothetical protein [Variovorax boronicumulans]
MFKNQNLSDRSASARHARFLRLRHHRRLAVNLSPAACGRAFFCQPRLSRASKTAS